MKQQPSRKQIFLEKSKEKAQDKAHKRTLSFNIGKYTEAVKKGKTQFNNLPLARELAKNVKWYAIEHLDQMLEMFEKKFTDNGGKVIWAKDAQEAQEAVLQICKAKKAKLVVKSKSMATEEIHLNQFLATNGIEALETDLGEYIQQLAGEAPYHIVTPAMHKSKEEIARLFYEKLGAEPGLPPERLTLIAREKLREKFTEAEIGITGGNFLIADEGAVCITENEGNGRLATSFPKTHIAIVGIEKVLPSLNDLNLFWPLLATFGTGQTLTSYNSIFSGSKQEKESDGPNEMYVILLDNGRTNLLQKKVRESMYCIRCGACLNVCPVYQNIGGHAYDSTYSGPIGSVITPHLTDLKSNGHLSYASTLCGACTETCPVNINIHGMLLENRRMFVKEGNGEISEKVAWRLFRQGMLHRKMMNMAGGKTKNLIFRKLFMQAWGGRRAAVEFAPKSFNQLWEKRHDEHKKEKP